MRTFVIIKPDAVNHTFQIIARFEKIGLRIVDLDFMTNVPTKLWHQHYAIHKNKPFFNDLINGMKDKPICWVILEGEDVINRVRQLVGATKVSEAEPGTIRHDFGKLGRPTYENVIHASDSSETAKKEIYLWLSGRII